MMTPSALRRAGRAKYAVLRLPLHLLEERVVQRYLSENSLARLSFERVCGALDAAADRLLGHPDTDSDTGPAEASGPAAPAPESAAGAPPQGEPEVSVQPGADVESEAEAESETVAELTDELLEQEETENFAGELAEDNDLRQVQAELKAKRLIAEQQQE